MVILSLLSMSPSSPRLQRGPDRLSGILITTPPGDNHNNNKGLTHCYHGKKAIWHGGPFCHKNDHVSLWGKGATCMEHFIPFPVYLLQKRNNYKCCSRHVKLAGQWSCLFQPKEKNNMFELADATCIRFTRRAR